MKTITIPLRDGSTQTVPVRQLGGGPSGELLAVHAAVPVLLNPETYGRRGKRPLDFPWMVTHVPSGCSIGRGFRTLKAAGRALAIMSTWDWSRVTPGPLADARALKPEYQALRIALGDDMDRG